MNSDAAACELQGFPPGVLRARWADGAPVLSRWESVRFFLHLQHVIIRGLLIGQHFDIFQVTSPRVALATLFSWGVLFSVFM